MTSLASHSGDTVEGSRLPAPVVMTRNKTLTATVTRDLGTISVNGDTKAELLVSAKRAIECGERSFRDAAEALGRAQDNHGATQREMAQAVGMSIGWVNRLLKWRQAGYKEASPFGPTTRQGRVQHAEQRPRRHRSEKTVDADHRTNAQNCAAAGRTEAAAPSITNPARSGAPVQKRWSPLEATREFKFAIDQWWPLLDGAGRADVVSYFNEKTTEGAMNIAELAPTGKGEIPFWPKLTESGFPATSGVNQAITAMVTNPQKRSNSSVHRHGDQ